MYVVFLVLFLLLPDKDVIGRKYVYKDDNLNSDSWQKFFMLNNNF